MNRKPFKIAVIGLGYVGLPLSIEFGKKREVIGFDIDSTRIKELKNKIDNTGELSKTEIGNSKYLKFTNNIKDLIHSNCYLVTVPTPITSSKKPDLSLLINAYKMIGNILKKDDIVILESTVYPGTTNEICAPLLEYCSGLTFNKDFYCGYSPERINPGDKKHTLSSIKKITSGSNDKIAKQIDELYKEIIKAGTYLTESIEIAEAAKIIENTQRDVNIALINEFSIIFNKMGIDTQSVLSAAKTKWNFLPFTPGLVGGHCIGVDPYYLTYKAEMLGYNPKVILSGRQLNDSMGLYIAKNLKKLMIKKKIKIKNSKILLMGLTFKENCQDIRNTKVYDIFNYLKNFSKNIDLYDPLAASKDVKKIFKKNPINKLSNNKYDAIIISVPHLKILKLGIKKILKLCKENRVICDVKSIFPIKDTDLRL